MSGGAKASTRPAAAPLPSGPIQPPLTRQLAFATMKPSFVPPDDYHRFSSPSTSRVTADRDAEAIVVRSPVRFNFSLLLYSFGDIHEHLNFFN
jgi:transcription factor E2F3